MAFVRNKKSSNPNFGKKMSVNFEHPIFEENKKVLDLLDEIDKRKIRFVRRRGDKKK
jgi:hypothetical protein